MLLVLVGGVLGSLLRWVLVDAGPDLPVTLAINVAGTVLLALLVRTREPDHWTRPLLGTGFCGGFTTMSAFAVQAVTSDPVTSAAYVAGSLLLGVGAARLVLRG